MIRVYYNFLTRLMILKIEPLNVVKMIFVGLETTFQSSKEKNIDLSLDKYKFIKHILYSKFLESFSIFVQVYSSQEFLGICKKINRYHMFIEFLNSEDFKNLLSTITFVKSNRLILHTFNQILFDQSFYFLNNF